MIHSEDPPKEDTEAANPTEVDMAITGAMAAPTSLTVIEATMVVVATRFMVVAVEDIRVVTKGATSLATEEVPLEDSLTKGLSSSATSASTAKSRK